MKMEQTQFTETSAIKHHTPGNTPKDYTKHKKVLFHEVYILFHFNIIRDVPY
jgi:hypothetical protein